MPFISPACRTAVLAAACIAAGTSAFAKIQAVGQATLVIGSALVHAADGSTRHVERGTSIHVGDRVETEAGGHVHLRFVDGGRVSVRPSSRLLIESYAPSQGGGSQASGIKFRLDTGVARSITGEWGQAERERFRLNTPVAAIGVKGTDFIVQTNGKATAATVYSGAIVVTPMSAACTQTLGPCANGAEQLLTEGMRGQMVAVIQGQIGDGKAVTLADSGFKSGKSSVPVQRAVDRAAEEASSDKVNQRGLDIPANAENQTPEKPPVDPVRPIDPVRPTDPITPGETVMPVKVKDLFWARYPWAKAYDGDNFSRDFDTAMLRGNTSLAGSGSYSLMAIDGARTTSMPAVPVLNLRIGQFAGSVIRSGQAMEALTLNKGTLQIDLARATFETRLDIQGPTLGRDTVQASGELSAKGLLRSNQGNAAVYGGMNAARTEAGYLFIKPIEEGQIQGVTLWGP